MLGFASGPLDLHAGVGVHIGSDTNRLVSGRVGGPLHWGSVTLGADPRAQCEGVRVLVEYRLKYDL